MCWFHFGITTSLEGSELSAERESISLSTALPGAHAAADSPANAWEPSTAHGAHSLQSLHSHQLLSKLSFENTGLCTMSRAQKLLKSVASLKHEFELHTIWHKLIVSIIEKRNKLWCVNASTKTTTKKKNKNICEPIYTILTWLLFDKLSKISMLYLEI